MIRPAPPDSSPPDMADLFAIGIATTRPGIAPRTSTDPVPEITPDVPGCRLSQGRPGTAPLSEALQAAIDDGYDPILWLGEGSSSEAWRCVDRSFGREVVVKVIRPGQINQPEEAESLLQSEAEVLGRLNHPGIVHAVRRAGSGDTAYLALDFVDGDDLLSHCRLCQLGIKDRLRLFGRFVDAVAYLHAKDIVHGDLKPEHILVREDGHPVLIDFGLAAAKCDANHVAQSRQRVGGSKNYRAPEVLAGTAYRGAPQHDVFAMGEILRELTEDSGLDVGALQQSLHQFIQKATATQPQDRWPDAGAFQDALQEVLTTRPLTPEDAPAAPVNPAAKPSLRAWLLIAATLALVACGGTMWMIGSRQATGQAGTPHDAPRSPVALTARAGLLEGIAAQTLRGETHQADEAFAQLVAEDPASMTAWEVRHLRAGIENQAFTQPFGESPYRGQFAVTTACNPAGQTIAYVHPGGDGFDAWVRAIGKDPIRVATTKHAIRAVALRPDGQQVATLEGEGRVALRPVQADTADTFSPYELPREPDARLIWFSRDGNAIYIFSPAARTVERWSATDPQPAEPQHIFRGCDHAYPLPSGDGSFLLATLGTQTDSGRTQLRHMDAEGKQLRAIELVDNQLPVSADTTNSEGSLICLGMPDGYVRIHDPSNGGWQTPCDLGLNEAVPAVLYSLAEERVFAACSRVYVIDTTGQLMMRLGDRDDPQQLITGLQYDKVTGSLTSYALQRIQQWQTSPSTQ